MAIILTKPVAGSSGWAETMNDNIDLIQNAVNGNINANAELAGNVIPKNGAITPGTKTKITYDANGLVTAGADLIESDIPELNISKISGLANQITSLQNALQALSPDLSAVAILASFQSSRNGLYIKCSTQPQSAVYHWFVEVRNASNAVVEAVNSSSSNILIDGDSLTDNEVYTIRVSIRSANASWYGETFSHRYVSASIEVDDIVAALIANNSAMTLFANTLAGSNILAQKIAEAGQAQSST